MAPASCRSAADVDALAARMFGAALPFAGVAHVTALWASPTGELWTIAIGPGAPTSEHDLFALNLARARSDAILVTGKVLRDEPELVYELGGPGTAARALAEWRQQRAGRAEPPWVVVLTSGRGLDPRHPALHGWARPMILTTPEASLPPLPEHVSVVRRAGLDARAAIRWLREDHGAAVVSVEAGPSTTRALYEPPVAIDELWLSVFRGRELPAQARAGRLLSEAELVQVLEPASSPFVVDEPSGPWTFQRYVRRDGPALTPR